MLYKCVYFIVTAYIVLFVWYFVDKYVAHNWSHFLKFKFNVFVFLPKINSWFFRSPLYFVQQLLGDVPYEVHSAMATFCGSRGSDWSRESVRPGFHKSGKSQLV